MDAREKQGLPSSEEAENRRRKVRAAAFEAGDGAG